MNTYDEKKHPRDPKTKQFIDKPNPGEEAPGENPMGEPLNIEDEAALVVLDSDAASATTLKGNSAEREMLSLGVEPRAPKLPPTMTRESAEFADFEREYLNADIPMSEDKARAMAQRLHAGQTDQLGVDYIDHPEGVLTLTQETPEYAALTPEEQSAARVAALLHDTVEDTALREEDLTRAGCSDLESRTIMAVTSLPGEPKPDYYARVMAAGPTATAVKLGDLSHNNLPSRRESLPGSPSNPVKEGELDRFTKLGKKYWIAYTTLGSKVPSHLQQFAPE